MKKYLSVLFILALILVPTVVFAGGDEDSGNEVDGVLEDQIYKTRELEDKVADLEQEIDDLKNRPPQIVKEERVVEEGDGAFDLPIHGYFNLNYADSNLTGVEQTFDQENFALLFDYELDEQFRFGAELLFRHGTEIDVDQTAVYGEGEVLVPEAYLDWKFSDAHILKFGKFLTPYGNWNIPLRSPAKYLSVWEPILIRRDLFPRMMTGIQYYGKTPAGNIDFLYNVYLGNGKGWRAHSEDDNNNHGIGARLALLCPFGSSGTFEVGASGYYGQDGTLNDENQDVFGVDAVLNVFPFELRGEYAESEYNFPLNVDYKQSAWYLQGSVNFLEKYDAYLRVDQENTSASPFLIDDMKIITVGLNYKPIPVVAFKVEYDQHDSDSTETYEVIAGSVAVDF